MPIFVAPAPGKWQRIKNRWHAWRHRNAIARYVPVGYIDKSQEIDSCPGWRRAVLHELAQDIGNDTPPDQIISTR